MAKKTITAKEIIGGLKPLFVSERRERHPIVRVVITEVSPGQCSMKAYDDRGHLRSGLEPTDCSYAAHKAEEWFPGVPVEHKP